MMYEKQLVLSKHLIGYAIGIILLSVLTTMFQFEILRQYCVCISNYLAWAQIGFGLSIFTGLSSVFIKSDKLAEFLRILQFLLFSAGIVYIVLFGSKLLKVI